MSAGLTLDTLIVSLGIVGVYHSVPSYSTTHVSLLRNNASRSASPSDIACCT